MKVNTLLEKYLSGLLPEEEIAEFLKASEDDLSLRDELIEIMNTRALCGWISRDNDEVNAVGAWVKFKNNMTGKRARKIWAHVAGYAASALIAASLALFVSDLFHQKRVSENGIETLVCPPGQRAQLTMSDGTIVWLNSNSKIVYPSVFSTEERHVELEGEAYFEVTSDESHPFTVSTEKSSIKVTGTHFNVFDYPGDDLCSVSLLEGKVDVSFNDASMSNISLRPHQRVEREGESTVVSSILNEDFLLWKKGIYAFDDCRFIDMVSTLEQYYNVSIIIKNKSIESYRFSGKFRQRDGIESLLRTLKKLHKFRYERDEQLNVITIY